LKILVIEDSIDLATEVAEVLRGMSHDVEIHGGESLDDVLTRLVVESFELVIVDLGLPGFEGTALIDALALTTDAPAVIVATGSSENKIAPLRPRVDGVLRKPFTVEELGAVVRRAEARRGDPKSGIRPATGPIHRRRSRGG
jgi:two-component system response regulator TctD